MKISKKIYRNKSKIFLLAGTLAFLSCQDYLDVDTDKDNSTNAPLNLLLTSIEVNVDNTTDFLNYTGDILQVYTHQMVVREEQDQYGTKVNNINVLNEWNNTYLTLTNIETLIKQGTESGDMVYVGLAQLQKAYLMSVAVDLFGDVPYTEAGQLASGGIISPKFDNQAEIYAAIMDLIETGKANVASDAGIQKPAADDLFYGGDTEKWIKFANTFKLKLYNQTRLSPNFDQAGFDALIAENNFFDSNDDDFQFNHQNTLSPSDERNKFFLESYNSTQFTTYMSPWFYEILKGMNPNIHTGNEDPRIPYYFFNQLEDGQLPPDLGDPATGNPKADYWDSSTGFFTIRFGSIGPYRDFSTENSYTYPGIFPAGGRYDDNQGGNVNDMMNNDPDAPAPPTGIAPHRILTYAEFLYIQAELIHVGKLTGNEGAKLQAAMEASFAKVDEVVDNNQAPQTIPNLVGSAAVTTFIGNVMAEFNAASADKKLEIMMTQKWVATFGDPFDQYNDYRRTGYPILANPNSTSPEYQLDNGDGFPLEDSQTVLNNPFPLSFYWPQSELEVNANAPIQKVGLGDYRIFWDIN
ncbi:MAG: SusD/RagB family nutrient-binding outer membrane lipoprotein [Flavobacterium sp. BFFFF1]|uniref:SusD/RagB family nutrient-binding outer membrane lipoprotein n=1 Tax=Flavobacterium sp. BFFFF1 TaxID=2015557 RepID=UPI000BD53770|nr:SusD/RagB family nutrient-binding outer membrane lipoprotein [Flavobacterium sp. BFFFF1]OYU81608.1 MAG: SusD/RagB family nutrient-binding outer membrane lipoprotein [Flavobacterium sp. BFFFF1]